MDECTTPGIFWPYGNTAIKMQLTYLLWNTNCKNTLTNMLNGECTAEQRRDVSKKLVYAHSLVEQQSNEIVKLASSN